MASQFDIKFTMGGSVNVLENGVVVLCVWSSGSENYSSQTRNGGPSDYKAVREAGILALKTRKP